MRTWPPCYTARVNAIVASIEPIRPVFTLSDLLRLRIRRSPSIPINRPSRTDLLESRLRQGQNPQLLQGPWRLLSARPYRGDNRPLAGPKALVRSARSTLAGETTKQ